MKPLKPWSYSTITHGPNFDVVKKKIKKNCSPIQSWSGENWLQSWSTFIFELLPSLLVGGTIGNEAVVGVIFPFITQVWLFDVTSANSGYELMPLASGSIPVMNLSVTLIAYNWQYLTTIQLQGWLHYLRSRVFGHKSSIWSCLHALNFLIVTHPDSLPLVHRCQYYQRLYYCL